MRAMLAPKGPSVAGCAPQTGVRRGLKGCNTERRALPDRERAESEKAMKKTILLTLLAAAAVAVAQQSPVTPNPTTEAAKPPVRTEVKLPDLKAETKLALRDVQAEWLTTNIQVSQLEKQLDDAKANRAKVEQSFREVYDAATAEGKKAGVDTDKNEIVVPVGPSSEIKWAAKKEPEVKK
jgi:hypothetical protein